MTKHFIEIFYPGSLFAETATQEIKSREEKVNIPKESYGFRFFDQSHVLSNGETLIGPRKNVSGMTFIGKKYSLEELKQQFPEERRLYSNVKQNFKFAVKTRRGNWQGVGENDIVLESI
jgi:hypothetical protein